MKARHTSETLIGQIARKIWANKPSYRERFRERDETGRDRYPGPFLVPGPPPYSS